MQNNLFLVLTYIIAAMISLDKQINLKETWRDLNESPIADSFHKY